MIVKKCWIELDDLARPYHCLNPRTHTLSYWLTNPHISNESGSPSSRPRVCCYISRGVIHIYEGTKSRISSFPLPEEIQHLKLQQVVFHFLGSKRDPSSWFAKHMIPYWRTRLRQVTALLCLVLVSDVIGLILTYVRPIRKTQKCNVIHKRIS